MELILIKSAVSVFIIIGLSLLAEHVSPRVSGIISGYPLGGALTLFFLGYEISPDFAAASAVYTVLGLISSQVLALSYYLISARNPPFNVVTSAFGSVVCFLCSAFLLGRLPINVYLILPLTCLATFGFHLLFRRIDNSVITKKKAPSFSLLISRAIASAMLIILITGIAKLIGPRWAGLFSSFPIVFFPLLIIIHFSYHTKHVHSIIKNFPQGLGSLILYLVVIHYSYPAFGLFIGTVSGLVCATIYLTAVLVLTGKKKKSQTPD